MKKVSSRYDCAGEYHMTPNEMRASYRSVMLFALIAFAAIYIMAIGSMSALFYLIGGVTVNVTAAESELPFFLKGDYLEVIAVLIRLVPALALYAFISSITTLRRYFYIPILLSVLSYIGFMGISEDNFIIELSDSVLLLSIIVGYFLSHFVYFWLWARDEFRSIYRGVLERIKEDREQGGQG